MFHVYRTRVGITAVLVAGGNAVRSGGIRVAMAALQRRPRRALSGWSAFTIIHTRPTLVTTIYSPELINKCPLCGCNGYVVSIYKLRGYEIGDSFHVSTVVRPECVALRKIVLLQPCQKVNYFVPSAADVNKRAGAVTGHEQEDSAKRWRALHIPSVIASELVQN